MRRGTSRRWERVAIAAALGLAGLTAFGLAGLGQGGLPLGGRAARAQPGLGGGPVLPGETVIPQPLGMPGESPDRWLLQPDPRATPVIEGTGILQQVEPDAALVRFGGEDAPAASVQLAPETTYYVEGQPTTFDQMPEGVPALVTYELRGADLVALRIEVLEGDRVPPVPEPVP